MNRRGIACCHRHFSKSTLIAGALIQSDVDPLSQTFPFIRVDSRLSFLKTMLDEPRSAPVEARNIFNAMLRAVTEGINQR